MQGTKQPTVDLTAAIKPGHDATVERIDIELCVPGIAQLDSQYRQWAGGNIMAMARIIVGIIVALQAVAADR